MVLPSTDDPRHNALPLAQQLECFNVRIHSAFGEMPDVHFVGEQQWLGPGL
jgi:hypothetical protein